MKVLVINTGSSSLKFSLFEAEREQVLAEGAVDWSTMPARFTLRCPGQPERRSQLLVGSHGDAVGRVLDELTRGEPAVLRSLDEIAAVGHRVVHGGDVHTASVQVTPAVKKSLAGLAELAPLHNPANLEGIHAAEAALPGVPQVAVFDTAFHATIPEAARVYPLPYAWYRDWGLRRYGFHGLSHAYCAARAAQMLGRTPSPPTPLPQGGGEGSILFPLPQGGGETNAVSPPSESPRRSISSPLPQGGGEGSILSPLPQGGGEGYGVRGLRLVICHLGNGCSASAVRDGVCVDTSMGFTPLEGLMMGTRSGSVDPGLLLHVLRRKGLTPEQLDDVLNHQSGLLGVSGVASDMRQVLAAARSGHAQARLALDIYAHRIRQMIGALAVTLGGVDGLVFTAGVGENAVEVRAAACAGLDCLGLELDPAANAVCRPDADVATPTSPGRILVIATREDLMIARETVRLAGRQS